ncbi:MAG: hypothetical protein KDD94_11390, partial [Calditrichaeota bacterium]|nr:hypothetical protein [Calditrichota bacterium]
MKLFKLISLAILVLFFSSCEDVATDPPNPVTINYIMNGVLPVKYVSGTLTGNSLTIPFQFNIANTTSGTVNIANVKAGTYALSVQAYTDSLIHDETTLAYSGQGNYTVVEDIQNTFVVTLDQVLDPDNMVTINFTLNGSLPVAAAKGTLTGVGDPINFNFALSTDTTGVVFYQSLTAGTYNYQVFGYSDATINDASTQRYSKTGSITVVENVNNVFN